MARSSPRPTARKGWPRACDVCATEIWIYPSRPNKTACSLECRSIRNRAKRYNDKEGTKLCINCSEWKPFAEYAPATGEKAGSLQAYCNPCALLINRAWAKANPEKRRATNIAAYQKAKESGVTRVRTEEEKQKDNAARRAWGKANRHKTRIWNKLRAHRLRAAGEMPEWGDIEYLLCAQDARCPYCNIPLSSEFHIDHKIPVSKGGMNDVENLQLTCPTCNMRKGVKSDSEFRVILFAETGGWLAPAWQYVL